MNSFPDQRFTTVSYVIGVMLRFVHLSLHFYLFFLSGSRVARALFLFHTPPPQKLPFIFIFFLFLLEIRSQCPESNIPRLLEKKKLRGRDLIDGIRAILDYDTVQGIKDKKQ